MNLKDLHSLEDCLRKQIDKLSPVDVELPSEFKEKVKSIKADSSLIYNRYTFIYTNRDGQIIIYPNQCWYIASYLVDLYDELCAYKDCIFKILGITVMPSDYKISSDDINKIKTTLLFDEGDRLLLEKFVTDLSWWKGGKQIARNDFFVSPLLSTANVINASNNFLAELTQFLATQKPAVAILKNNIECSLQSGQKRETINSALQQIFYGSPGTGKSFRVNELTRGERVVRVTFHPDTDYAAFVGSYKPSMEKEKGSADNNRIYSQTELINILTQMRNDGQAYAVQRFGAIYWRSLETMTAPERTDIVLTCGFKDSMAVELPKGMAAGKCLADKDEGGKGGRIVYKFVGQAFCKAYVQAWKLWAENPERPQRQYLVIEEINRGNCAQIFGDLFQLLDRNGRGFSEYPVEADEDLGRQLQEDFASVSFRQPTGVDMDGLIHCPPCEEAEKEGGSAVLGKVKRGEWLLLPPNLFIWATMNTSDQSLFPIDSAFKRRWEWEYAPLCDARMGWQIKVGEKEWDWWQFLQRVNEEIGSLTLSEDKKLGYFFVHPQGGVVDDRLLVGKVIFYLWNDVLKDYEESSFFKDGQGGRITFDRFYLPASLPGEARVDEQAVLQFMKNVMKNEE